MAPPKRPWFRFYVEAVHDRKLRRLKPETRWLFVACLAAARQSPRPGWLLVGADDPMDSDDLSDFAHMPRKQVDAGMRALADSGVVVVDAASKAWFLPNWNDRQFESDESTARASKSRRKNPDATAMQRPIDNASDVDATPPETEAETETETDEEPGGKPPVALFAVEVHAEPEDPDAVPTKPAEGLTYARTVAAWLRDRGVVLPPASRRDEAYLAVLRTVDAMIDPSSKTRTTVSRRIIADYVEDVADRELPGEALAHLGSLVKTHGSVVILEAMVEAIGWGAGLTEKYAADPISLTKYIQGILSKRAAAS